MNNFDCDIIIITWNGLEYTKKCLESVESKTKRINYRYIFVDNNSNDGTLEYLKTIPNSILISNKENLGFVKAMNQGFEKADSKYVVWLNNDTIVTPNWLSYLIKHLEEYPEAGAIGPITNGTGIIQRDEEWNDEATFEAVTNYGKKFHNKNKNKIIEYHRIAGFCILMKGELIKKVGNLDVTFSHGGYDDDDYCKRIRDAGYKIIIAEDVFIYHKSGATFSRTKDPDFDLSYLMQKGKRRLLSKWVNSEKNKNFLEKNNSPLVSIVMATKEREKLIPKSIQTVINQTYKNWELIVVNDSLSSIRDVIEEISDPRIRYIDLADHNGKSYANNIGIKNSNGEIIAYLDDDDRWYPNHLEAAIEALTRHESRLIVYTDYVKVDCILVENKEQFSTKKEIMEIKEIHPHSLDQINFIPNFCVVHKKSLFDKAGNYDEKLEYYEDWDILRRFSKHAHFVHIPEVTGEYWINQFGASRNVAALTDKNAKKIIEYIKNKDSKISNSLVFNFETADNLLKKNNPSESLKFYKKILQTDPDFIPAMEGYAECLYQLKKFKDANEFFDKLEKLNPYSLSVRLKASQSLIKNTEIERAKKMLESALLISDDKSCYHLLQDCYKKLGNNKTAEFIKKKTSKLPENISMKEIQEFLLSLYNNSPFFRKLFIVGYKILKKLV